MQFKSILIVPGLVSVLFIVLEAAHVVQAQQPAKATPQLRLLDLQKRQLEEQGKEQIEQLEELAKEQIEQVKGDASRQIQQLQTQLSRQSEQIKRNVKRQVQILDLHMKILEMQAGIRSEPVDEKIISALLQPARTQSMNNLKQIALAMHVHYDAYRQLPARANFAKDGKPLLSWRVHILPFIEQNALYKQFNLDEPWDSPTNKKLIARIPPTYVSPLSKAGKDGKTTYLAVTGKGSIFDGVKGLRFTDVTDGTSNTIMIVEANDTKAVFWTQPEDFPIDAKEPLAGLVREEMKGFLAAFADGSVRMLSATIRPATLHALFTRSGGEIVDPDN